MRDSIEVMQYTMSNSKSQAYEKVDTFVDIFVDTSGRRAVADGKKEENRPGVRVGCWQVLVDLETISKISFPSFWIKSVGEEPVLATALTSLPVSKTSVTEQMCSPTQSWNSSSPTSITPTASL